LGWHLRGRWLLILFKHRREILRAGRSLANTDSYGQPDSDGYSNADAHTYSYGHGNSDCNCDADSYANCDTQRYRHANGNAHLDT
jgi:hypothetical protein